MSRKCYLNKSSHSAIHLIVELTVTGWFHCPFKILLSLTFVQGLLVFLTFFSRWWKLNRIATRREFPCVVMTTNRALSLWCPNESQWWACSSGVQLDQSQWCFSNHGQGSWLWMTWGSAGGMERTLGSDTLGSGLEKIWFSYSAACSC